MTEDLIRGLMNADLNKQQRHWLISSCLMMVKC